MTAAPQHAPHHAPHAAPGRGRQRGAALVEFAVVGPVLMLLGLAVLQYGLLFFAKNSFNHAAFMAARAGSVDHANLASVRRAYVRALVPLYGGGIDGAELARSQARAEADVDGHLRIELLNPTKESFDDWNDPALQRTLGQGRRVIPNGHQAFKDPARIGRQSGQNIHDANLIKLRITQGHAPQVPLVRLLYSRYLQWLDPGTDAFHTQMVAAGRIPVVTHVTLQMQSDAIEPDQPVSIPGPGNNGQPGHPAEPPVVDTPPPDCASTGCSTENTPPADPGTGTVEPPCGSSTQDLPADLLFAFGSSQLSASGQTLLDHLITQARSKRFDSLSITGYTDPLGSDAVNQSLSLARAGAVRDYLRAHGFPDKPIHVEGRGAQNLKLPLSSCPSGGQAQIDCLGPNRRVELSFKGLT